ncbi:release factor glutamine methyltransferase [Gluconacetobacter liquefaciens]|uniref:Release factor glutamine methyltransferase n=1 Tax=Gluconacetobacter liquefaciens TaxID=89584 RepID=A0A370FYD6_GLULI|nr:peptide chain release factor N(5)-glutamine methyltransferase [Gluconacetobacter liquefaciens]MBB2187656.1 peptide chain release factor N(5)-glutamine methyltransferase [Gluconacetobacter liquefaciens]RDI36552.1 release factor glutamine methyltransferase [Gluconacetobacter liquefaciens]GEB37504.1 release factor glutamine methyltransferase [Gluconacetobacter liquefaciens]
MKEDALAVPGDEADLRTWLGWGGARLRDADVDDPRREARLLMAHVLGTDLAGLLARARMTDSERAGFVAAVRRRAAREPMAHITGRAGFWSLELETSPATLIPRPDSETLIEALLDYCPDRERVRSVLDLGTGAGCLLLAALSEYGAAWGVGVDIAPDAARLAARNARRAGLEGRSAMLAGDWAASIRGVFDVVFSNPPYIPQGDLAGLMPDVRDYEPVRALDGGADGLDAYRLLTGALPLLLAHDGVAVFEIGIGQENSMPTLARQSGLEIVDVRADLGGIPRAVVMRHRRS